MPPLAVLSAALSWVVVAASAGDGDERKFADCPAAVRKTFAAETKGARIETVTVEKGDDDETVFWADVVLEGKNYAVGVLEDGTLAEMNLAADDSELPFEKCPAAVQATFRRECFGEPITTVGQDMKYGVNVYEAVVASKGMTYEVVVAQDGTLVEKVLVIEDEEVELAACPEAVRTSLRAHAGGGKIGDITRSTGLGSPTYEAEVEFRGKVYLLEVSEKGLLISKSLEAEEE
jgi:hypothetical protein